MKIIFLFVTVFITINVGAQEVGEQSNVFEKPFRLMDGKKVIDVTTGHATPYIYDFNKDGLDDLLVGEFGKVPCPDYPGFVQGRCRIYLNKGTNKQPKYNGFEWLMADDKIAYTPCT